LLNAWDEWTEGSYLLPEKRTGNKYFKVIKNVFSTQRLNFSLDDYEFLMPITDDEPKVSTELEQNDGY